MTEEDILRAHINVRGRATGENAKGRFERVEILREQEEPQQVKTEIFKDTSKTILSKNDSPDVGFSVTLNPYRGCEHGCIYCYARPTHEYLGLSAGLDFETKIFAKMEAPSLLENALSTPTWVPQVIGMSGVTDCYQPCERQLELTRQCLNILATYLNPVVIITKNALVTRDIDILQKLAARNAVHVVISITTLEPELARFMEPRASSPALRLAAIEQLRSAGIRVSVNMAPIVPGLTDHEIPSVLEAAASAGALTANYVMLRLPYGVKDLFENWLENHYPFKKDKVLNRIRHIRKGKLNSAEFGERMEGQGIFAEQVAIMFKQYTKKYSLDRHLPPLSTMHFKKPVKAGSQLELF